MDGHWLTVLHPIKHPAKTFKEEVSWLPIKGQDLFNGMSGTTNWLKLVSTAQTMLAHGTHENVRSTPYTTDPFSSFISGG
jgi:hypothetical protein